MVHGDNKAQLFAQNGFLHLSSFASPQDCQRLILRMRELCDQKCPNDHSKIFEAGEERQSRDDFFLASAKNISFFFDKNANKQLSAFRSLNKVGHALHTHCPVFKKFSHQSRFYDLMKLLGHQKPFLLQSMFIFKQPYFGDEVPAHQDASFLYTEPNSAIGLWLALQDANKDNGCLWVLPKGHHGPLKNRFLHDSQGLHFDFNQRVNWPLNKFVPLEVKAGDLVVLHGHLPHFSQKNRSNRTRFAYTIHFIDQKCHYKKDNWLKL